MPEMTTVLQRATTHSELRIETGLLTLIVGVPSLEVSKGKIPLQPKALLKLLNPAGWIIAMIGATLRSVRNQCLTAYRVTTRTLQQHSGKVTT